MIKEKKELCIFLGVAFGIPLLCITLIRYIPLFKEGIANFLLYGIQATSPTIAALCTVYRRRSEHTLTSFLKLKYGRNSSVKTCLLGFLLPAVILTFVKLILYFGLNYQVAFTMPSVKKFTIIEWALVAEELGWRGYLQDKIEAMIGTNLTPLVVGIIWALWHYHFFVTGTMGVPLLAFTYGCVAESYGYFVLTKISKGNILPASLWHLSGNLFINLYLINPNWNNGNTIPFTFVNISYTIYIIFFLVYILHKKQLERKKIK